MLHLHLILPIGFAILHAGCWNKCKLILNKLFAHNKYFFVIRINLDISF